MEKEASWVGEGREKADVVNECYNKTGQQKPTLSVLCAADLCARELRREGWLVAAHPIKCFPPSPPRPNKVGATAGGKERWRGSLFNLLGFGLRRNLGHPRRRRIERDARIILRCANCEGHRESKEKED